VFEVPAGERCDFREQISFTLVFNDVVFGDPVDVAPIVRGLLGRNAV
jgi:hypothetical protein